MKKIAILGSTGSVGTQALEVINENPGLYKAVVLTAGNNADLLIQQAVKYRPAIVAIANENFYHRVKNALSPYQIQVVTGNKILSEIVQLAEIDLILAAMSGFSGLQPIISAITAGKDVAIANKEPLVVAGQLVMDLVRKFNVRLLPVDSEHSAIFQCLAGEVNADLEKIYITGSGGPFRGKDISFLSQATPKQALKHPNWSMGNKITIDSASLMNKGLEIIEAKWLFNLNPDQIEVIIHPQSVIHSLVQFSDGSIKAQLGVPDMKLPIHYAFNFPRRAPNHFKRFSFFDYPDLSFEKPDLEVFSNLALAYESMKQGGVMPCVLNAANEVVVNAFLENEINFVDMSEIISETISKAIQILNPSLDDLMQSDIESRRIALKQVATKKNKFI